MRRGDARLEAFLVYVAGFCDVLVLQIGGENLLSSMIYRCPKRCHVHTADERLFGSPVIIDAALEKLLNEGCVQDMRKVVRGAEQLKKLAQKYAKVGAAHAASFCLGFFFILRLRLTQSRYQKTTMAVRLSRIFPLVKSLPHGLGRR